MAVPRVREDNSRAGSQVPSGFAAGAAIIFVATSGSG
jgi:hypothetical protein